MLRSSHSLSAIIALGVLLVAPQVPQSAASTLVKDIRLPTSVKPIHYNVILAPYIYGSNASEFYFTGYMRVRVHINASTSNIKLHSTNIAFDNRDLRIFDAESGKNYTVKSNAYDVKRQWHSLDLVESLPFNSSSIVIEIVKFRAPLKPDLRGFYLSSYTEKGVTKYLATTQLQATDARKTFPCFDELAFKATFDVSLVRREDFKSISNMPSKRTSKVSAQDWFDGMDPSEEMVREDFETTPIMSTYLLAVIVSQLSHISVKDDKSRVFRSWARQDLIRHTKNSLLMSRGIIQFYESYFGVPFPLKKADQATVPDFEGAMENWGLVIYRESRFVYDKNRDNSVVYQGIGNEISHELAHMWFGNLVTPVWWDDLWLNEGFAEFLQTIGLNSIHPEWETDAQFVAKDQRKAFDADSKVTSHPVYATVYNPDEINQIFDAITYGKGSAILRMVHGFVGDEVFRKGVGNYLMENKYGNAVHSALYESLSKQYYKVTGKKIDIARIMDRWIKQMGYPVLNCTLGAGKLNLTQSHFLSDPYTPIFKTSAYKYEWIIPVTMATNENITNWTPPDVSSYVHWMEAKKQTFDASGVSQWYILNLRSSGFYRVNYDLNNWKALIDQLLTDHSVFSPQDRARMIDDSFVLAHSGYINYSIPLSMTKYLKQETHYVPWLAALSRLRYLYFMLHRQSPEFGPFSAYMRDLIKNVYSEVGLETGADDSHLTKLKRRLIVHNACLYELKECKTAAVKEFKKFLRSHFRAKISPDIREQILCEGVQTTLVDVWDRLFEYSQSLTHPGTKTDVIRSLGCSTEPWILNRYLSYALDSTKMRGQDAATVFSSVAANPSGLHIVWNYMRSNWTNVHEKLPGSFTSSDLIGNLHYLNSKQNLADMKAFNVQFKNKLSSSTGAMYLALENVRINIKWMENGLPVLRRWLRENYG